MTLGHPNLGTLLDRVGRAMGSERADVQATLFCEGYTWALADPAVKALLAEDRLPSLRPADVVVRYGDDGYPSSVTFLEPDGPASLERLRRELEDHLAPLIADLSATARRPQRALWRSASDRLAQAFAWHGTQLGLAERACELGERALALDGPLGLRPRWTLADGGIEMERNGCCLWWRTAAGEPCPACPLRRRKAAPATAAAEGAR